MTDADRRCTNCGRSVEDACYERWLFRTCRACALERAPRRWGDTGTARKWRYFPRWHMTRHRETGRGVVADGGLPRDTRPRSDRAPNWSRAGGEGLPVPHDSDADQYWLFTCCQCGRRWVDPPGPPVRCSCESTEIVCHTFDPQTYWKIKRGELTRDNS